MLTAKKREQNRRNNQAYKERDPERWKGIMATAMVKYRRRNPEKRAAWQAVERAVKTGRLVRPEACSDCAKPCRPEAHHHNGYDKPLDVVWLCRHCHKYAHHGEGSA